MVIAMSDDVLFSLIGKTSLVAHVEINNEFRIESAICVHKLTV